MFFQLKILPLMLAAVTLAGCMSGPPIKETVVEERPVPVDPTQMLASSLDLLREAITRTEQALALLEQSEEDNLASELEHQLLLAQRSWLIEQRTAVHEVMRGNTAQHVVDLSTLRAVQQLVSSQRQLNRLKLAKSEPSQSPIVLEDALGAPSAEFVAEVRPLKSSVETHVMCLSAANEQTSAFASTLRIGAAELANRSDLAPVFARELDVASARASIVLLELRAAERKLPLSKSRVDAAAAIGHWSRSLLYCRLLAFRPQVATLFDTLSPDDAKRLRASGYRDPVGFACFDNYLRTSQGESYSGATASLELWLVIRQVPYGVYHGKEELLKEASPSTEQIEAMQKFFAPPPEEAREKKEPTAVNPTPSDESPPLV